MKGKLYNSQASLKAVDLLTPTVGTFTHSSKALKQKKLSLRDSEKSPIRYFWKSSIPNSWIKLVEADKMVQFKDPLGAARNTLGFLEETQKYIHHICKPIAFKNKLKEIIGVFPLPRANSHGNLKITTKTVEPDIFFTPKARKAESRISKRMTLKFVRDSLRKKHIALNKMKQAGSSVLKMQQKIGGLIKSDSLRTLDNTTRKRLF